MRVEHEYERGVAWAYLAAMDVHRMKLFGCCEKSTGIEPFEKLVADVMHQPPYKTARCVFWIMDNGSSHRGAACVRRLQAAFRNVIPVRGPVHASWLNQIEIYFSIIQCKVLTPIQMTSRRSPTSKIDSCASKNTTSRSPRRSSGSSPVLTSMLFWYVSKPMKPPIHYAASLDRNTLPNL